MDFGDRIIELRKEKELSQAQLAQELGLSQSAIAKWETKRTEPTASAIILLSKYFNKSADYLLGLEDEWGNKRSIINSFNNNSNTNINIRR